MRGGHFSGFGRRGLCGKSLEPVSAAALIVEAIASSGFTLLAGNVKAPAKATKRYGQVEIAAATFRKSKCRVGDIRVRR